MNISELNYETIVDPFDNLMEREGGLFGAPGLVDLESVNEYNEKTTKEIIGDDLENLWIKSWIKSRNWKPGSSGFKLDGKTGKITCKLLEVTGGTISYNKTSFTDSANAGYYIGSEGLYFGATADANYLKYNINTADFTLHGVNVSHPTITGIQSGSEISIQGWQQDMTFSATDADTVAWTSGTITLLDGTTYSITGANTGNIVALTYIYLDIGASTTVLQTTTTASDAVGSGKILIAVAENNSDATSKATYQVFGGKGGNSLLIDNIAANSACVNELISNSAQIANAVIGNAHITGTILVGHTEADITANNTANDTSNVNGLASSRVSGWAHGSDTTKIDGGDIYTNTVTATQINVSQLSAISANVGTLTSGTIRGVLIETAASGKRVRLISNELRSYDSNGKLRWHTDGEYTKWLDNNEDEMARSYGWKTGDSYVYSINVANGASYPCNFELYGGPNDRYVNLNSRLNCGESIRITTSNGILKIASSAGGDMELNAYGVSAQFNKHFIPSGTRNLGSSGSKWSTIYRTSESACHLPTSNSAIGIIKKLKKPEIKNGKDFHFGKRHYFKIEDFPDEMKFINDVGKSDIELTRVQGVTLNAVRELVEKFDDLTSRLEKLEK